MTNRIFSFLIAFVVLFSFSSLLIAGDGPQKKRTSPGIDENVEVDVLPSPTKQVAPKYPEAARSQGITGTVFVKILVGVDGVPKDARVIKSEAPQLDSSAQASSLQWRFKPATLKGDPVELWIVIPFKFALAKDKDIPNKK